MKKNRKLIWRPADNKDCYNRCDQPRRSVGLFLLFVSIRIISVDICPLRNKGISISNRCMCFWRNNLKIQFQAWLNPASLCFASLSQKHINWHVTVDYRDSSLGFFEHKYFIICYQVRTQHSYNNNWHDKSEPGPGKILKIEPKTITLRIVTTGKIPATVMNCLIQLLIVYE